MNDMNVWSRPKENYPEIQNNDSNQLIAIIDNANTNLIPEKQLSQIKSAFGIKAYDMAAEYTWRFTMSALKERISTLGMKFVGDMLGRNDIDEYSSAQMVLTDYDTISLADQLGIIGKTGAMRLYQSQEMLNHFFSKNCDESLDKIDAAYIVKSSIGSVLSQSEGLEAFEFTNFRDRLQTESMTKDDGQVQSLANSALFYIRTVVNVLLGNAKSAKSATLEHSLANINTILPLVWDKIAEKDKWNVGMTYRDVVTDGNEKSATGLKRALMKVKGFDFVPESLRSNTFKTAAQKVINTHFSFNNFYNEPDSIRALKNLGSVIPAPALQECMDAYLLVYLGNYYGVSNEAAPMAKEELLKITSDRWEYFFNNIVIKDELVLTHICYPIQLTRFKQLLTELDSDHNLQLDGVGKKIYRAIKSNNFNTYDNVRNELLQNI